MIKLTAIGHLGKDATVNQVNGKSVINFSVAHTEKFRSGDEQKEKTIWIECAYWAEKTAVAPYLKKGTQVYVEGSPEVRQWEANGKHGASLQLRVFSVQLLSSNGQAGGASEGGSAPASQPASQAAAPAGQQDDLPF